MLPPFSGISKNLERGSEASPVAAQDEVEGATKVRIIKRHAHNPTLPDNWLFAALKTFSPFVVDLLVIPALTGDTPSFPIKIKSTTKPWR